MANVAERITVDPEQCGGRPCIRGMRIRVTDVLDLLANGLTYEQVLAEFPYLEPEDIRASFLGNAGSLILFRVGAGDARTLEDEFSPEFSSHDLENLAPYQIYTRILVDGLMSRPFSAKTFPPLSQNPDEGNNEKIIELTRQKFGVKKKMVEEKINQWFRKTN